jgi:histidinol-phosphate aminotransferase
MSVLDLARPELLELRPYVPAAYEPDCIRLNANESPWRSPGDATPRGLNRYPPPRPLELRAKLAGYYGHPEETLLVTRGSSEAIDLLIRGFCTAGRDAILISTPTFDMYRVYARIQAADVVAVPLLKDRQFALPTEQILERLDERIKIIFVCSPQNPTGSVPARADLELICERARDRALVVIDEAYREFSTRPDCSGLLERHEHVVLLRTLSKCVALAGVRCGALLAHAEAVAFLERILPPYTFPTPSIDIVLQALGPESLRVSAERVKLVRLERDRLSASLANVPQVIKVWPSEANFVLVETRDGRRFQEAARSAGILIRAYADEPLLENCVRITVGTPEENDRLLQAVAGVTDG